MVMMALAVGPSDVKAASDLIVEFADSAWDGKRIPKGQQCKKFGGSGATPPLHVSDIPPEANAIVIEFNDLDYRPLRRNGAHGIMGFEIEPGVGSVVLPAVPGGTNDMPTGVWLVKKNRAKGGFATAGYLPPCSGGRGNKYQAEVYAVVKKGETGNPLGRRPGARNTLTEKFLTDMELDWRRNGVKALQDAREADPVAYVKVVASLVPKDVNLTTDVGESFLTLLAHLDTKRLPTLDPTAESLPINHARALEIATAKAPEVLERHTEDTRESDTASGDEDAISGS